MSHFTVTIRLTAERLARHGADLDAALAEMLAPFNEATEDERFREFEDETDERREEYETGTTERVRMPNGALLHRSDERFRKPGTIGFGGGSHEAPADLPRVQIPFKTIYASLADYCSDYCGLEADDRGRFGYWRNPNAKWDWYQIGGRWTGHFPVKAGVTPAIGERGVFDRAPAPGKADVVLRRDLDIDAVAIEARTKAEEFFAEYAGRLAEPMKVWRAFEGPRETALTLGLCRVVQGPATAADGEIAIPWAEAFKNLAPTDNRRGWTDVLRAIPRDDFMRDFAVAFNPLKTYAALDDAGWHAPGRMGWFGMSSDKPDDYLAFARAFNEQFIHAAAETDTLVCVDCHI